MALKGPGESLATERRNPAEVFASHLEQVQWAPSGDPAGIDSSPIVTEAIIKESPFDLGELDAALAR
eukprot:3104516-Alexandrium_andersonii.AAC.1